MYIDDALQREIAEMPQTLKMEVLHFVQFLKEKRQQTEAKPKKRQAGTMPNLVKYIAPDFDEPLEDFEEYM